MYNKFRLEKNQDNKKNKPRAGWDEDEPQLNKPSTIWGSRNANVVSSFKSEENKFNTGSSVNDTYNYKPPENDSIKKQILPIEQKLIDDLIQPTGISLRPNETQLKEFARRVKSLDRELIFRILHEKISDYENMGEGMNLKILIKCLYVVEILLQNGFRDIFDGFYEEKQLFEGIKNFYTNNKKVIDVINQILNILDPGNTIKPNKIEINLLDENTSSVSTTPINLLDNRVDSQDLPLTKMNSNNINVFSIFNNTESEIGKNKNLIEQSPINQEHTKGSFSFIKKSEPSELNSKKSFNFIKSKNNNNQMNLANQINLIEHPSHDNNIFESSNKPSGSVISQFNSFNDIVPMVDLTKQNSTNVDEVFGRRINVDLQKLNNTYIQNFDVNNKQTNFDQGQDFMLNTQFNYDKINEYIDPDKAHRQKDPFNFVNDMLRNKKI